MQPNDQAGGPTNESKDAEKGAPGLDSRSGEPEVPDYLDIVSAGGDWITNTAQIFRLEVERSVLSIIKLGLYRLATIPLFILTWLSGALCIAYGAYFVTGEVGVAFITVFLLQLGALCLHLHKVKKLNDKIGFSDTREEIRLMMEQLNIGKTEVQGGTSETRH
ncbi:hypothetical protein [Teredinibacter turnerae]|uniref:hypothetical protein n=1 Tax=Teredinibacter turnerae TaxID=2426 RepID=UPI0030CCA092